MAGLDTWTPLFSSIVQSSVWGQPPHVKIVWITMLALKDRNGFVESSVSGLARAAVVTQAQCREALDIFESPDGDSKCKDNRGLKIRAVEGGWVILGHERFQNKMKEVSSKIGNALRQKKFRDRKRSRPLPGEAQALKAYENGNEAEYNRIAATPAKDL